MLERFDQFVVQPLVRLLCVIVSKILPDYIAHRFFTNRISLFFQYFRFGRIFSPHGFGTSLELGIGIAGKAGYLVRFCGTVSFGIGVVSCLIRSKRRCALLASHRTIEFGEVMNIILVASIGLRIIALGWSVVLMRRLREWRF